MTEALRILDELGNSLLEVSEEDIQESVYPAKVNGDHCEKVALETAATIMGIIKSRVGEREAFDFETLVLHGRVPPDTTRLLEFFKGRDDVISKFCLSKLTEAGRHGTIEVT